MKTAAWFSAYPPRVPSRRAGIGSSQTWLALCAIGVFVYGAESWRQKASSRATRAERVRFQSLVTCLLGADGPRLVYQPEEVRQRLRALAMETPLHPAPTWIDPCVPMARELVVHGAEVDVTARVDRASTRVAEHARALARSLSRVGLVWQVRAGDPETDVDHIAELLSRTASEIDLADAPPVRGSAEGPCAPTVGARPEPVELAVPGLTPLPVGIPERFLAGTPAPQVSTVSWSGRAEPAVDVISNVPSPAWRLRPQALVRMLPLRDDLAGQARVVLDGVDGPLAAGLVAAPRELRDPTAVSLDATLSRGVMWVASAGRGERASLARVPVGRNAETTAVRFDNAPGPSPAGQSAPDDEVAVAAAGPWVFAAYTRHTGVGVTVQVARARGDARAAVAQLPMDPTAWTLHGRRPGVEFCRSGANLWLVATSRQGWRVASVGADGVEVVRALDAGERGGFDEVATVRCDDDGMLVLGRERARVSPVVWCPARGGHGCEVLPEVDAMQPIDLAAYQTVEASGSRRTHPEWPLRAVALFDGTVIAARAAGTIVAVRRWQPGMDQWTTERVIFDAASTERGATVQALEVYADRRRAVLAVGTASGLSLLQSIDGGASWQGR